MIDKSEIVSIWEVIDHKQNLILEYSLIVEDIMASILANDAKMTRTKLNRIKKQSAFILLKKVTSKDSSEDK
jgi:hypothetical protein